MKKNNIIKYSKNALWLKPFVEKASKLVPLDKITYIRGYRVRIGCQEKAYASVLKHRNNTYTINIKMYDVVDDFRHAGSRYSTVLDALAHELAHVEAGFDHSPEHYELTCRIALIFSLILKKYDIMDTSKRIKFGN